MTAASVVSTNEAASNPSRAAQVTRALANSRDKLEAPFRALPEVNRFALLFGSQPALRPGSLAALQQAERFLAESPSYDEAAATREMLALAFNTPPDRDTARVTLGLLLSAYPNAGKEPREEYFATLLHDVVDEGVGPHVLAEACRKLRRETKFLPTIGEVIAACESAKSRLSNGVKTLDRQIELIEAADYIVSVHALPADEWPAEAWLEALHEWGRHRPWNEALGPEPGEAGCLVPADVIARYRSFHGLGRRAA